MIQRFTSHYASEILVSLALSMIVLICYQPVSDYGFINYDDPLYVTDNEHVQEGITLEGVLWAFRDLKSTNWHPLTWLSHMLDWQLFRVNAGGHHWTNVIFHLLNAILLFSVLRVMTGALWRSACVAALFAVHPLNVESVAWVAERKNVLSTSLGLLTLLFYAFYILKPGWKRYLPVLISFGLGLMAKPMLVTLPFLMLLLDFWPLGRFTTHRPAEDSRWPLERSRQMQAVMSFSRLLGEKIPLLVMASGSIVLTIIVAKGGDAMTTFARFPLTDRLANSLNSYVIYIGKMFWPENLAVFYPYPRHPDVLQTLLSGLAILSVTVLVLKQRPLRPYLLVGWFWFLGTLVPVIGLVQVGLQAMADRYAYLPVIGLFLMLVWGVAELSGRGRPGRIAVIFMFGLLILAGGVVSRHQLRFWESSRSLFAHALSVTVENDIAHSNLARPLFEEGDWEGAATHYREAIRINPSYANHYSNYGAVLVHQGKVDEAIAQYKRTLTLDPGHAGALFNMGLAMESMKRWPEADAFYEAVLRNIPDHRYAPLRRGTLAIRAGNDREAVAIYRDALRRRPKDQRLREALSQVQERINAQQK